MPSSMQRLLQPRFRNRTWYLAAVVATIVAGLASRRFPWLLPACLGKYPGDVLWALMFFLGMGILFRRASSAWLGLGALGVSFGIEALKLWDATWMVSFRHTTMGHFIFGSVFSWQNLVSYAIGVLAGVIIEGIIAAKRRA